MISGMRLQTWFRPLSRSPIHCRYIPREGGRQSSHLHSPGSIKRREDYNAPCTLKLCISTPSLSDQPRTRRRPDITTTHPQRPDDLLQHVTSPSITTRGRCPAPDQTPGNGFSILGPRLLRYIPQPLDRGEEMNTPHVVLGKFCRGLPAGWVRLNGLAKAEF